MTNSIYYICSIIFISILNLEIIGQELAIDSGHTAGITSLILTTDNKYLISASYDHTIKIWDANELTVLRTLNGHKSFVRSAIVTADRKHIISAGGDRIIKIWDFLTGEEKGSLQGHTGPVNSLAVTSDNKYIISGSHDNTVRIWDLAGQKMVRELTAHRARIEYLVVSPDNKYIASGSDDGKIIIWDLASGWDILTIVAHSSRITSLAATPDGKNLISGANDRSITIWNIETGALVSRIETEFNVLALQPTLNGKYLVSGGQNKKLIIWDLVKGEEFRKYDDAIMDIQALAISKDGKTIYAGYGNGDLISINTSTMTRLHDSKNRNEPIRDLKIISDGKYMVMSGKYTLIILELSTGKTNLVRPENRHEISAISSSNDDQLLASAQKNGNISIWKLPALKLINTHVIEKAFATSMGISPQNNIIIAAFTDKTIRAFDITGSGQTILERNAGKVNCIEIPNDTSFFTGGESKNIGVFDTNTGKLQWIPTKHHNEIVSIQYYEDTKTAYSLDRSGLLVTWNLNDNKTEVIQTKLHGANSLLVAKKENIVLIGSLNGMIRAIELDDKNVLWTSNTHEREVSALLAPDFNSALISGSYDGTIKVSDIKSGELLSTIYVLSDGNWLINAENGDFDRSPGGHNFFGWTKISGGELKITPLKRYGKKREKGLLQKALGLN